MLSHGAIFNGKWWEANLCWQDRREEIRAWSENRAKKWGPTWKLYGSEVNIMSGPILFPFSLKFALWPIKVRGVPHRFTPLKKPVCWIYLRNSLSPDSAIHLMAASCKAIYFHFVVHRPLVLGKHPRYKIIWLPFSSRPEAFDQTRYPGSSVTEMAKKWYLHPLHKFKNMAYVWIITRT